MSDLLSKILAERPKNAVDLFEEYSKRLKEERFKTRTNHLRDVYVPPVQYENAKRIIALFQVIKRYEFKSSSILYVRNLNKNRRRLSDRRAR